MPDREATGSCGLVLSPGGRWRDQPKGQQVVVEVVAPAPPSHHQSHADGSTMISCSIAARFNETQILTNSCGGLLPASNAGLPGILAVEIGA